MRPLQSLSLRQAIVQRLRADASLTAIGTVPAGGRIYDTIPATLEWPFVRYTGPDETPIRKGTQVRFTVHTFSKEKYTDETATMNFVVQESLEDAVIQLDGGLKAFVEWIGSQILADGDEADAHHGINAFRATIG